MSRYLKLFSHTEEWCSLSAIAELLVVKVLPMPLYGITILERVRKQISIIPGLFHVCCQGMSLKRKRDAQQVNVLPLSHWQASNTATATAAASFLGFPGAGQSVSGIHPGFPTTAAQMDSRKSHKSRRLRPPTSAINVVHQEDVKDVAGEYQC